MRKLLFLTGAVVFFDTLFFAALTPLLPHYAHELGLGKTGAGILQAAFPAGVFLGAVPSGIVAGRIGVKACVLAGLTLVAVCTLLFGIATEPWQLDVARFAQGVSSAFSWTGVLAWLVARAPANRRGSVIGQIFAAAVVGAILGPVLGGVASVAGTGWTFGAVAAASLGLVAWAAVTPGERQLDAQSPVALIRALGDGRMLVAAWFVVLPALLFGALSVLAPLRLAALGYGSVAIGAIFLCSASLEAANNLVVGRASDRSGPIAPILFGLVASAVIAAVLPWPQEALALGLLVVCAGLAFGTFLTPAMTLLANLSELRGIQASYASAFINLAWAPGQTLGAVGGGALAHATRDAVPYLLLAAVCALTLAAIWPSRRSPDWTLDSAGR